MVMLYLMAVTGCFNKEKCEPSNTDDSERELIEEIIEIQEIEEPNNEEIVQIPDAEYATLLGSVEPMLEADSLSSVVVEEPIVETIEQDTFVAAKEAYSEAELEVLYRITEAEAGGEDEYGRTLVANVVLNRVQSSKFPNTIRGVVFDRKYGVQFTPTTNGRYYSVTVSDVTKTAVHKAIEYDYSDGALYFRTTMGSKGKWHDRCLTKILSHGCHTFYK